MFERILGADFEHLEQIESCGSLFDGLTYPIPFLEAIEPVVSAITRREVKANINEFSDSTNKSLLFARQSHDENDHYSIDEIAMLKLYTFECNSLSNNFNNLLNRTLQSSNRSHLKPFSKAIFLLLHSLKKCQPVLGTLYCGLKDMNKVLKYKTGREIQWHAFSSLTIDLSHFRNDIFVCENGDRYILTIEISNKRARKVPLCLDLQEIILPMNSEFMIVGKLNLGYSIYVLQLRDVSGQDTLTDFAMENAYWENQEHISTLDYMDCYTCYPESPSATNTTSILSGNGCYNDAIISKSKLGINYCVRNKIDDKLYAIKVISVNEAGHNEITMDVIHGEATLLQRLNHPNLARYFYSFYSSEGSYLNIVMEFVENAKPLSDKLTCTPSPTMIEILDWITQISFALEYLHSSQISHRNLTCDTVLVNTDSTIKLTDLNLTYPSMHNTTVINGNGNNGSIIASDYTDSNTRVPSTLNRGGSSNNNSGNSTKTIKPVYHRQTSSLPEDWIKDDLIAVGCIIVELLLRSRVNDSQIAIASLTGPTNIIEVENILLKCTAIDAELSQIAASLLLPQIGSYSKASRLRGELETKLVDRKEKERKDNILKEQIKKDESRRKSRWGGGAGVRSPHLRRSIEFSPSSVTVSSSSTSPSSTGSLSSATTHGKGGGISPDKKVIVREPVRPTPDEFIDMVRDRNTVEIGEILELFPELIDVINKDGVTALRKVCRYGYVDIARLLLLKRPNIDLPDELGYTALMIACKWGYGEIATMLLDYGADVDSQSKAGVTPLMEACASKFGNRYETIKLLVNREANINSEDENGNTALLICIEGLKYNYNPTTALKLLIEHGAQINHQNKFGFTALMIAADRGYVELVKLMLSLGADADTLLDENGNSTLMIAVLRGRTDVVKLLLPRLQNSPLLTLKNKSGNSLLMEAARLGYDNVVTDLLAVIPDYQSHIDITNNKGMSALMNAAESGHGSVLTLLLEKGASINIQDETHQNALMLACKAGKYQTANILIERGVDLHHIDKDGNSVLMLACSSGQIDTIQLLLQRGVQGGVDVNYADRDGASALIIASCKGYPLLIEALLAAGGDIHHCDKDGKTALSWAAYLGHLIIIDLLLDHHADINHRDKLGQTALMEASSNNHSDVVKLLLRRQATPSLQNHRGKTALMLAGSQEIKSLLS